MSISPTLSLWKGRRQQAVYFALLATLLASCEKNSEIKVIVLQSAARRIRIPTARRAANQHGRARMPGSLAQTSSAAATPSNWEPQPLRK
jgi:hypothetical protein